MSLLESMLFGILQGIFEWLPISSQGEMMLVMVNFFGYTVELATKFSFFLHIGTTFSAILYFRRDVKRILSNLIRYRPNFQEDNKIISFLLVATLISGTLGFFIFKITYDVSVSGEILLGVIGVALIITGLLQKFSKQREVKSEKELNLKDSIILGIVQAFSAIPGLSRSGITVSALLFRGYQGKDALRLSFLMAIPAILGAQLGLAASNGLPDLDVSELGLALLVSFVVGYLSIGALIRIAARVKFWIFTIIIGAIALSAFVGLF